MEIVAWAQRGLPRDVASEWRAYCQARFTEGIRGATWRDLKTCLEALNSTPETRNFHTFGQLLRLKQEEGMDIMKFESKFTSLALELPEKLRDDHLVTFMMHQLQDEDRVAIQAGGIPVTREEFREKALRVQARATDLRERRKRHRGDDQSGGPSGTPPKRARPADGDRGPEGAREDRAPASTIPPPRCGRWRTCSCPM